MEANTKEIGEMIPTLKIKRDLGNYTVEYRNATGGRNGHGQTPACAIRDLAERNYSEKTGMYHSLMWLAQHHSRRDYPQILGLEKMNEIGNAWVDAGAPMFTGRNGHPTSERFVFSS